MVEPEVQTTQTVEKNPQQDFWASLRPEIGIDDKGQPLQPANTTTETPATTTTTTAPVETPAATTTATTPETPATTTTTAPETKTLYSLVENKTEAEIDWKAEAEKWKGEAEGYKSKGIDKIIAAVQNPDFDPKKLFSVPTQPTIDVNLLGAEQLIAGSLKEKYPTLPEAHLQALIADELKDFNELEDYRKGAKLEDYRRSYPQPKPQEVKNEVWDQVEQLAAQVQEKNRQREEFNAAAVKRVNDLATMAEGQEFGYGYKMTKEDCQLLAANADQSKRYVEGDTYHVERQMIDLMWTHEDFREKVIAKRIEGEVAKAKAVWDAEREGRPPAMTTTIPGTQQGEPENKKTPEQEVLDRATNAFNRQN